MAHNLTIHRNGKVEMAYWGDSPWHALGQKLEQIATSGQMLTAAGLDWTVSLDPVYRVKLQDGGPSFEQIKTTACTVRTDNQKVLGVMSSNYKPVQNRAAFAFMDSIVGEAAAMYHTAGSLHGGKRVWALAKLPQSIVVTPADVVDQYLLLVNDHGGDHALTALFTPIRVVCDNTLRAALGTVLGKKESEADGRAWVRHVGNLEAQLDEARRVLGIGKRYFEIAGQAYQALSAQQISDQMLQEYYLAVFPLAEDADDRARVKHATLTERLAALYQGGKGADFSRGTAWGAYNSVAEWIDHVRLCKQDGAIRAGGAEATLFGEGQTIRQRAFDRAMALVS